MDEVLERLEARLPDRVVPLWELAKRTVQDSLHDRVPGLAAEAAFFALLSLVPMLLAVVGTAGFVAKQFGEDTLATLESILLLAPARLLTADAYESLADLVHSTLTTGQGRIISFGFLFALWAGSRAIATYLNALRIAYDIDNGRSAWRRRLLAVGFMLVATVAGVIVLPSMVLGPELAQRLLPSGWLTGSILEILYYPVVVVISVGLLASFYHVGVPWDTPWRRDLPGAVLAVLLWLAGSVGVRIYAELSVARSEALYGFMATPLVLLVWIYITSLAVLLGAELNAEIEKLWPHERFGARTVPHVRDAMREHRQVPTGGPS